MEPAIQQHLREIFESGRRHDETEADHSKRFLNLEPDTARLISILARSSHRTRVLEIGTSTGYSTIWLAWSVRPGGGRVTTIERDAAKGRIAEENLRKSGLLESVDLQLGDATTVVAEISGPFDMVFFDADRITAPAQLRLLVPKLTRDALVLADNALSHPSEIADYLQAVESLPGFEHLVVPIGKGLSLAYRPEL
ncbi:MAG TPA: class I SAM-dependent methyltransferase [Candidatus Dormibacteraeota bacterium]|nr:class I SAM-dependent methyltransferase [Candidatus Dormibacteraeota bacterium]